MASCLSASRAAPFLPTRLPLRPTLRTSAAALFRNSWAFTSRFFAYCSCLLSAIPSLPRSESAVPPPVVGSNSPPPATPWVSLVAATDFCLILLIFALDGTLDTPASPAILSFACAADALVAARIPAWLVSSLALTGVAPVTAAIIAL